MVNERVAKFVKHIARQKKEGWTLPSKSVGNVKEERPQVKKVMQKDDTETDGISVKGTEEGGGEKEAQDCPVHERPSVGMMVVKTQKLVIHLITSTMSCLYARKTTTGSTIEDWISAVR